MSHDAVCRYHYRGISKAWLTTVTVWLKSRDTVAECPCKCGSWDGIYNSGVNSVDVPDAVIFQLVADFLLGSSVEGYGVGTAVFQVSVHETVFPPAIRPAAQTPFAVQSFCHVTRHCSFLPVTLAFALLG